MVCRDADNAPGAPGLPASARLPVNRCNLPAVILGSLTFQAHPVALRLDGVAELHRALLLTLAELSTPAERALRFREYMTANFRLDHLEEAGYEAGGRGRRGRSRADYLRMLRGWLFDADGREAAVLKSWVESRFGLLPRSHQGPLGDFGGPNYQAFLAARSQGLYNTNALESQLDLLYTYSQYELAVRDPAGRPLTLYRGLNRLEGHEVLCRPARREAVLLLNNLNSFTANRERACEFGDTLLEAQVPPAKVLFFPGLLPDLLRGEEEHLVIGGLYRVRLVS
jgi:NAD+---dinitrogen-reductase ADP-D-ribosyltransferase